MTNEQILNEAIDKATNSGWKGLKNYGYLKVAKFNNIFEVIIFNHSFARAFFKNVTGIPGTIIEIHIDETTWRFHLKQMVLAEEPLQYIKKFL